MFITNLFYIIADSISSKTFADDKHLKKQMKVLMFTCSVCFHLFNVCAYNGYKECNLHQMFVPESLWPILLHHFVMFKLFCRVRKSEGPEDFPSTPGIPARSHSKH